MFLYDLVGSPSKESGNFLKHWMDGPWFVPSSQQHIFFGVTPHVWLTGMREGREEGGRRNDTRLFSRSSPIFRLSNLSHSFGYQSKEARAIEANKCLILWGSWWMFGLRENSVICVILVRECDVISQTKHGRGRTMLFPSFASSAVFLELFGIKFCRHDLFWRRRFVRQLSTPIHTSPQPSNTN